MNPEIRLPLRVALPGMEVLINSRFFHGIENRPPMLHSHPCFELTCVERETETCFILVPPHIPHLAAVGQHIMSLLFSFLEEENAEKDICTVFRRITEPMEIPDTFRGLERMYSAKAAAEDMRPGAQEQIAAELRLLLVCLARYLQPAEEAATARTQTLDEERLGLLEECFNVDFRDPDCTKQRLARRIGVSERQLSRILLEKYNDSFSHLLLRTRMNLAQAMLMRGGCTKSEVAEAVGYRSLSSFRRAYKAFFGHPIM